MLDKYDCDALVLHAYAEIFNIPNNTHIWIPSNSLSQCCMLADTHWEEESKTLKHLEQ